MKIDHLIVDVVTKELANLQHQLSVQTDALKAEHEARVQAERSASEMARRIAYVLTECGGSCAMAPESIARVDKASWQISTENADGLLRYRITFRPEVQTPAEPAIDGAPEGDPDEPPPTPGEELPS